jgi:aminoglycoside phosphotransferase
MTSALGHGLGGHADRPVVMRERDGMQVIVKAYLAADGARVFDEHCRLWASPLGARRRTPGIPEPLGWDPATRELTMEAVNGAPLGTRSSLGQAPSEIPSTARLLADLHSCGVVPQRRRAASRIVASLSRKADDLRDDPNAQAFRGVVEHLARMLDDGTITAAEQCVPTHGDWSPRNVLMGATGVRMIDLDRLQFAGAGRDVTYWGAWAWVTQLLAGGAPDWGLATAYEAEYLRRRPDARAELAATRGFHRAAGLLRIAHGWSVLAHRLDLRRTVIAEARRQAH